MVQTISSREFSRNGKEGTLLTIRQRGVNERSASIAASSVAALKFPVKSTKVEPMDTRMVEQGIGPIKTYEVDVFIPLKDAGGTATTSGDVSPPDMN